MVRLWLVLASARATLLADDECASDSCALHALQTRTLRKLEPVSDDVLFGHEADVDAAPVVSEWLAPALGASESLDDTLLGASPEVSYLPPSSPTSDLRVLKKENSLSPPSKATQYNGVAWPEMVFPGTGEMHVFTIGDWGGLLWEQYGDGTGLHVFPFIRPSCNINDMKQCFNETGDSTAPCNEACGYVAGVDNNAQVVVAEQMKKRAAKTGVQYFLNVGDNFYPQGMNTGCGSAMSQIKEATKVQFTKAFDWVYSGPLSGKVWLSVLGNHDYGARQFDYAWDQQVAFTWASDRWVMPALYFSQHVRYPDLGFDVDIFMLDSNVMDAHGLDERPGSNLCHRKYNVQADCSATGGPASVEQCAQWFSDLWNRQASWMEEKLNTSTADWQIAVTHFPCGHKLPWYSMLRSMGLDLLVTGHIHEQQLQFLPGQLTCLVTGGGGGITSERSPQGDDSREYGFFDLTLSKSAIKLDLVNHLGNVVLSHSIPPFSGHVGAPEVPPVAEKPQVPIEKTEKSQSGQSSTVGAACSSNPKCAGLDGDCCPTAGGAMLGCCESA
ncbi:unnamed protein product [Durusdinium trenchii]